MPWRGFLLANAGGAVIWATVFGIGGYLFGKVLLQLHGAVGPTAFVLATAVVGRKIVGSLVLVDEM